MTDRLFEVFFDAASGCGGSRFRLFDTLPERIDFDDEYAVISVDRDSGDLEARFMQRGEPFEFCGAGALCIASALSGEAARRVHLPTMSFEVAAPDGEPQVALPVIEPDKVEPETGTFVFSARGVGFQLLACASDVRALPEPVLNSKGSCATHIALAVSHEPPRIDFRYFTAFGGKGEDQATGSLFRYLGALDLRQGVVYRVRQHSERGAAMWCRRDPGQIVYGGKVHPLG